MKELFSQDGEFSDYMTTEGLNEYADKKNILSTLMEIPLSWDKKINF